MSRGKTEGSFEFKQKIEWKRKEGDFDLKVVATNKDCEYQVDWAPKDLNDGIETTLSLNSKMTPKPDAMNWTAEANVHTGGFEMGPIRPHLGLFLKTNNK